MKKLTSETVGDILGDDELFKKGIFNIVQELHMSITGSSDPLPEETKEKYLSYLYARRSVWENRSGVSSRYDKCVLDLVHAVLSEVYNSDR